MAIANYDCHKCTNNYVGFLDGKPAIWCKPAVDGKKTLYISKDTGSGKTMEFSCDYYTTEPRQQELRIFGNGRAAMTPQFNGDGTFKE